MVSFYPNPDKPELNKTLSQRRKDAKIIKKLSLFSFAGFAPLRENVLLNN
jgi:hypothetical protein